MPAVVSKSHPRMVFVVAQHASPWQSFFTETGSLRLGRSSGASGRNTAPIECSAARRTRRL